MSTVIDPWASTGYDEAQAFTSDPEPSHQQPIHDRDTEHESVCDIDELAVLQVAHDGYGYRCADRPR